MSDFDNKFEKLYTELVEIGLEFVINNSTEVDTVYVIGLIESGYFYKVFYTINNHLVKSHKVNNYTCWLKSVSSICDYDRLHT